MRKTNKNNQAAAQGGLIKASGYVNRAYLASATKMDTQYPVTAIITLKRRVSVYQGTRWVRWWLGGGVVITSEL